ncbi:hypothetical protein [Pseudomonas sp. MF4836]|uniref:hypothetical protein n=1 Tax=Pseudomonas sp. MF4836 TaxID=1960827 RepID=UPI0012907451|nr:hypothetical protein [Pseudomonas sp. MF4836]
MLAVAALAGCGSQPIDYAAKAQPGMTRERAVSVVEQVFYEDFSKKRPQYVEVTDEFILLSDGTISKSSGFATAAPIGNGAIAAGNSTTVTKAMGQRIYFRSLGTTTIHKTRGREGRYTVVIRNVDGSGLRNVHMRTQATAEQFIDAVQFLKTISR